jgi:outer membrane biogenesis lipoprotein LolB
MEANIMKAIFTFASLLGVLLLAGCGSTSPSATAQDDTAEAQANQIMIQQQEQQTVENAVDHSMHTGR